MLKNAFLFRFALHELKKTALFRKPKGFRLQKALRTVLKKPPFYVQKAFYSHKTFLNCYPKQLFFALRCPFQSPLTYCPPKNTAVLLLFALILCCKTGASHRFKSLPAIPSEDAAFRKTGYRMIAGHFRNNHVSTGDLNRPRSPEVRKPLVYFWYFSYTRKVRKTFLSQEAPRFCQPRISAPQPQLRTATIKTFPKGRFEVFQTSNQLAAAAASHIYTNKLRYFKTAPAVSDIHTTPPVARKTGQTSPFSGRLSRYTLKG